MFIFIIFFMLIFLKSFVRILNFLMMIFMFCFIFSLLILRMRMMLFLISMLFLEFKRWFRRWRSWFGGIWGWRSLCWRVLGVGMFIRVCGLIIVGLGFCLVLGLLWLGVLLVVGMLFCVDVLVIVFWGWGIVVCCVDCWFELVLVVFVCVCGYWWLGW